MAAQVSVRVDLFRLLGDEDRLRLLALCAAEELTVVVLANTGTARVDALERTLARLVLGIPEPEGDVAGGPPKAEPSKPEPKPEPPKTSG